MSTIDLEKLTRLDPYDVYKYIVQFDPKSLTHEDILAIFRQISAYDLLKFYLNIYPSRHYAKNFCERIATIDAYEFALICYHTDNYWLSNARIGFYKSKEIFDTDYGRKIHNAETVEYWQDLQKTFTSLFDGPPSFKLDEYFRRFSFPTNQLIIFASKQPGFAEKYSQLSPELQAKYCHPKDIAQYFSLSLPLHIRLGLLMRQDNLQDFLQSIPHVSLSALESKFIEASNIGYTQLPEVIINEIESLLRDRNDELYIVQQADLVKRFLMKKATMRDLEYVIEFANLEDLMLLPKSMVVFEKICLLRQDLDSDAVSQILRNYPNLSQDQLLLLMKNQKMKYCSMVVARFLEKFGVTRQLVDFLIKKHLPETVRHLNFQLWDFQSRMRYIEATWQQIDSRDIEYLFFMDWFSVQEQYQFVVRTCELCFKSVKQAFKHKLEPITGTMIDNQQVCSYLCNNFPVHLGEIFGQFSQFGQNETDLFPLVNDANFKGLFKHDFDAAESLVRRIRQENPDLQSNLKGADMTDANVLIWVDFCEPEYVADLWSKNMFSNIVEALPSTRETLSFLEQHFDKIKHSTGFLSQVFAKMRAKDIVRVLRRPDFPHGTRHKMFMRIVDSGNTKIINMLFEPEFVFLLLEAKDRLIAINPEYAARIDAVPRPESIPKRFRSV